MNAMAKADMILLLSAPDRKRESIWCTWVLRLYENSAWSQKIAIFTITGWALGIILCIQDAISQAEFERARFASLSIQI
jgi:hypothetical protein